LKLDVKLKKTLKEQQMGVPLYFLKLQGFFLLLLEWSITKFTVTEATNWPILSVLDDDGW
jgi:hypothetical protein